MEKYTRIRSPVVVAEGRLTIFPSFDRISRINLSGVRRSTIDWQSHLSPEFQLLSEDILCDIKALSLESMSCTELPSAIHVKEGRFEHEITTYRAEAIT